MSQQLVKSVTTGSQGITQGHYDFGSLKLQYEVQIYETILVVFCGILCTKSCPLIDKIIHLFHCTS